ncbi:MAG: hypothetical protein Q9166_008188, partial [cf. Caloplaca sp. 2 TL-2023]
MPRLSGSRGFVTLTHLRSKSDRRTEDPDDALRFAIFVDDDDFDHLDQIFTQDVIADYAGAKNHGLPAFAAFLKRGLGGIVSQHAVSSTVIEDLGDSINSTA